MPLTARVVGALVAAMRRKDAAATVFAIESSSMWAGQDQIDIDGRPTRIREARSALRLREVLHEDRAEADLVILTDLDARAFGRENLAKVALRRIEPVQPWPVVRTLFGVASVDPRLVRHAWMAERLLQAPTADRAIAGGTLDFETAWSIVLGGFGLRSAQPSEEEFLEAASRPEFAQAYQALPAEGCEEFKRIIEDSLNRFGTTVLAVVERGYADQVLAAGLVAQCLFEVHDSEALPIRGAFGERFGVRSVDGVVASRWGSAVRKLISKPDSAALASRVRAQADALLVGDLGGAALAHASSDLPSGLTQRVHIVAKCVERTLSADPSEQALCDLRDAVRRVKHHVMAEAHGDADRASMAFRLVRWLAEPRPDPAGLEAAIRRYAEEECWVDRARVAVRDGESVPEARHAYQALAQRVGQERAKLNASVAPAAIAASLPAGGLIGVEHVLEKVVAPLAAVQPLALIVMDGLSHAVALDLVRALEEVAWRRYRPRASAVPPLVLSTIPTVTEFARTSLLCGALRDGGQTQERDGFSAFLRSQLLGGAGAPTVFHKDKLDDESSKVEEAIRSNAKVIACVVNAIDAQLDGSDQLRAHWNLRTVPVFGRLVRACELAGRAIVLVSDHGHLVEEATEQLSGNGVGTLMVAARWRASDGVLRPGELRAEGPRVRVNGGVCVVAADERVRYGSRHAGYHGGVTVQELACPLHVLVHSGNDANLSDWVPVESTEPSWWQIDGRVQAAARPAPIAPRPRTRLTADPVVGGGLFEPIGDPWIAALFTSAVYADQRTLAGRAPLPDDQARRVLEAFVQHASPAGGPIKLTEQALAARLELNVADLRRRVTLLRNLLNVDGYEVLAQPDRDSLTLDVDLLKTQFSIGGGAV